MALEDQITALSGATSVMGKDMSGISLAEEASPNVEAAQEKALPTQEIIDWLQLPENADKYSKELAQGFTTVGEVSNNFEQIVDSPDAKKYHPFGMMLWSQIERVNTATRTVIGEFPKGTYADAINANREEIQRRLGEQSESATRWMPQIGAENMEALINPPSEDSMANLAADWWYMAIRGDAAISRDGSAPTPVSHNKQATWDWLVSKSLTTTMSEQQIAKSQGDSTGSWIVKVHGAQISPEMTKAMKEWYIAQPAKAMEVFKKISGT